MFAQFHLKPVGHALGIVGSDGRVYGGIPRGHHDTVQRSEKLLRIVEHAYMAGLKSMRNGGGGNFEIRAGKAPDGKGRTWEIADVDGYVFAAVGRGLWPKPTTEAVKLKEVVEHAFARARDHVTERTAGISPEGDSLLRPAFG